MTALFWWLVTNSVTQATAGGLLLAALLVATVGRWVPGVAAWAGAARAASYAAVAVLGLGIGYRSADETSALRQAQTDLAFARLELDAQRRAADVAAQLRAAAEADAAAANEKVTEYETWLAGQPADCGCALDDDDVRRLRDIAR